MPTKSKQKEKDLTSVYDFMSNVYLGNWQYRFKGTPHMRNAFKKGQKESILAHELACIGLWFNLRRICPNLNKLVNSEKIYEILWTHDLGEIYASDVSLALQVQGRGTDRHKRERESIIKMAGKIPKKTLNALLQNLDSFEGEVEKMTDLEIVLCKWLDNVQGHHFALTFGNDHKENSDLINKILNYSFVPRSRKLLQILKERKYKKAYEEAKWLIDNFTEQFRKAGVELKLEKIY
jgi:5'-deoxynucleotidase YfbR-like HD superfamily hydrolase